MTIVKSSITSKPRSISKNSKKSRSGAVDIFSNSQLSDTFAKNRRNDADDNLYESFSEDEEESQAPKEDLEDLFVAIQSRLKKKTIDQKKAMENELKRTINKTVDEMNEKIINAKNQIDNKLSWMKSELENIQKDRENQLRTLKMEYGNFQQIIQKSIDKIDFGEKRIHMMREKFLTELSEFNANFDFPKEKLEEIFDVAVKDTKHKIKGTKSANNIYYK